MKSQTLKFKDMPFEFQRSIIIYGGEDGFVDWTVIKKWAESNVADWFDVDKVQIWIDDYSKVYADREFRVGTISVKEVIEKIMLVCEYDTFEEYHEWYDDDTDHGDSVFPIVTSDCEEYIEDGWHRFHSYVSKGLKEIPFVEYVPEV